MKRRFAAAITAVAILHSAFWGGQSALAVDNEGLSDACIAANDPILDSRYSNSTNFDPPFRTGFGAGETLTVTATNGPTVFMVLFASDDPADGGGISYGPDFTLSLQFDGDGQEMVRWASFVDLFEGAIADWTVECTGPPPLLTPFGFIAVEGPASTSQIHQLPVFLSAPSDEVVTVDYATVDDMAAPVATAGSDFVSTAGTLTFPPGETVAYLPIEVLGDNEVEPPLYGGEWGLVNFFNVSNATLDVDTFFGHGLFIIFDQP